MEITENDINRLIFFASDKYREHFKSEVQNCVCAPGRVNLIGEHTDYNDGFVLPMALPLVTVMVGGSNNSSLCHILTVCDDVDSPKEMILDLSSSQQSLIPGIPAWGNYVKGAMANYKGKLCGFNAVIATSIPVGGGLSSSAALEVAVYTFLNAVSSAFCNGSPEELKQIALSCQKAEHDFCGMPCGIMDQFVSVMAKKDHALLLDCRSLEFTHVPLKDDNVSVLITNTNVKHKLTGSEYPTRKKQCETAAKLLGKSSLRDATLMELENAKEILDDVVYRRAKHVITEIDRTLQASSALKDEMYEKVGILMNQSHKSLKNDFEVSCSELDQVVEAALECDGVYGSRMTGGGFGGCTVTLVKTNSVLNVIQNIKDKYDGNASFYVCRPASSAYIYDYHPL